MFDPVVAELIAAERVRQLETLCLIPSENHVSAAVLAASGSVLMNKYSEGYPGRRYYQGNGVIDEIERLAVERAAALFGVEHANVQPLSGAPANLAVYAAFLEPGDTVLGHVAGRRRAPDARLGRVGDGQVVPVRALRRAARHGDGRPRRGARARAAGAAEADLVRRHGDPADDRLRRLRGGRATRSARCWPPTWRTSPG